MPTPGRATDRLGSRHRRRGGQRGGHNLAGVGVHAEVQLAPRPAHSGAVFLEQPLAWPAQLEPRAVHQQVHGLGIAPSLGAGSPRLRHVHRCGPSAEGGVVRHTQGEAEQADDGADQAFGLPERQAEHGAHGQGRQDGELRIPGLPASGGARVSCPRANCLTVLSSAFIRLAMTKCWRPSGPRSTANGFASLCGGDARA